MKNIKIILVLILLISLASCKKDMSDLDRFFVDAKNIPPQQIEQLPSINSPEIFIYEADESRDPFSNDLEQISDEIKGSIEPDDGSGPNRNRRKESLENYPLDGLYMVGTYLQEDNFWALIEDPEGVIHRVSVNDHLGQNYGEVLEINEDQIDLSEWISDGLGSWTQREASIALREE